MLGTRTTPTHTFAPALSPSTNIISSLSPKTLLPSTSTMALTSSISLRHFFSSATTDLNDHSLISRNLLKNFSLNRPTLKESQLFRRSFKLTCSIDREMDVSTSALIDGVAECLNETQVEPRISTMVLNFENKFDPYEAISTPPYQTATFKQLSATENGPYDYTRSGNPTRDALESLLAKLDEADRAFCFTSGMAALAAVSRLVGTGEEIVAGDDLYGGSDRLLSKVIPKNGIVVKRVNTSDLDEVASAIGWQTKLVWLESPTNPRQQISDIRKIAEMTHKYGALLFVDNSIMSPILSQPLTLGADIVMHSATKFIAGHSDPMAGVLAVRGESLAKDLYFLQNAEGSGLAPFGCWICL
ncbi:cystathionine beta-lyase, chloroplastic-like [Juglans regia]|uniref:cysteine-S-conjugate beta-lyase n=1 Tax=Juglans regia TaxID=51240 RepID=A0A2I4GWX3_JUGRE|nr:cystathionine beta-lyase, chloroplastic-like [Juglans regia]